MYQKSFFLLNFQTPIFYTLNLKILKSEIYFLFLFLKYTLFVETKEIIKKNPQAFRDLNLEKKRLRFFLRQHPCARVVYFADKNGPCGKNSCR